MKIYLRTFGCRANHYDSESVQAMAVAGGHTMVASPADADVAIFNSCAVTADAEADLRQAVRKAARTRPSLRSIVMGCAAGRPLRDGDRDLRTLPTVEHVLPGAELDELARVLEMPPSLASLRAARQSGARALLRVQDGCDEHCTFCVTTLARGASRSRLAEELVRESETLAASHPEIVITGIHIGHYGRDIGSSLGELVETLVHRVPDVRFRLSSLEATEVDERLFALLTQAPHRVAPHLHAPLQSGSNGLLKRMGRHWYDARSYAERIERLVAARPIFGLGADVIVGFPGETDADHRATVELVERLPFTYLHVFPFSLRPGTPAERLGPSPASAVVTERARELRELAEAKAAAYAAQRAGGTADVVVVRSAASDAKGVGEALTEDYLSVLPGDPTLPRRARFMARLKRSENALIAVPTFHPPALPTSSALAL